MLSFRRLVVYFRFFKKHPLKCDKSCELKLLDGLDGMTYSSRLGAETSDVRGTEFGRGTFSSLVQG